MAKSPVPPHVDPNAPVTHAQLNEYLSGVEKRISRVRTLGGLAIFTTAVDLATRLIPAYSDIKTIDASIDEKQAKGDKAFSELNAQMNPYGTLKSTHGGACNATGSLPGLPAGTKQNLVTDLELAKPAPDIRKIPCVLTTP